MKIFQVQSVEKIVTSRSHDAKLVVRYKGELMIATFFNKLNSSTHEGLFDDEYSRAQESLRTFQMSNTIAFYRNEPITAVDLYEVLRYVEDSPDSDKPYYYPVMSDITSLTYGYHLPFLVIDPTNDIEVVSIFQDV